MARCDFEADIVILGVGVGGHACFRTLNRLLKRRGMDKRILLIDKHNYFSFTPLYHEVASGSIEPAHCTTPLRELIYKTPHTFLQGGVEGIDPKKQTITTTRGTVAYRDACVVALGSHTNFCNTPGAREHAYHVRSLDAAMTLQEALIEYLEACKESVAMSVVGGGATGVEVAGQFCYFAKHDIMKLYPQTRVTVRIIQARSEILTPLPKKAKQKATKKLQEMGVDILFNTKVKEVKPHALVTEDGKEIQSDLTVWAAGFENIAGTILPNAFVAEDGRIPVTHGLHHADAANLYAIGDIARGTNPGDATPFPQLGEAAHNEGVYVARHIASRYRNKTIKPFRFSSAGTLMPLGDWYGILSIKNRITFFGRTAWWIRRTFYLFFMPGFLRKLRIIADWNFHLFGFRYMLDMHKERRRKDGPNS